MWKISKAEGFQQSLTAMFFCSFVWNYVVVSKKKYQVGVGVHLVANSEYCH